MAISGVNGSGLELLLQGQGSGLAGNASADLDGTDSTTEADRLEQWLERRRANLDKKIQQAIDDGQLSQDDAKKLENLENQIDDKMKSLQAQGTVSASDRQELRQLMGQLSDEMHKLGLGSGHHHGARKSHGQTAKQDAGSTSDEDSATSQGIDVYA